MTKKVEIYEGILEGAQKYTSWMGKVCYKTFSPLSYYFLKCEQLFLKPKCINSLSYEAENDEIELSWCEEDLIIHFKHPIYFVRSFYSDWQQVKWGEANKFINNFIKRTPTKEGKDFIRKNYIKTFGDEV